MKTAIVWFRNDLRIHDHPALATALATADTVIPLFILNEDILNGRHSSSNRNRFLLECLTDLKHNLQKRGTDLIVRSGSPDLILKELSREVSAEAIYYTADYSPYAIKRDKTVKAALQSAGVDFHSFPGRLAVSAMDKVQTKAGTPHKVFTPYYKNWLQVERRKLAELPDSFPPLPSKLMKGSFAAIESHIDHAYLSPNAIKGGETNARKRLQIFISEAINTYHETNNNLGLHGTSRLSSYLHFGCLSPVEIERLLPDTPGATAWRRQLAWRDFYHYILFYFPQNAHQEFQDRYRNLKWETSDAALMAWEEGRTGYPVVDASMRQLRQEGWMHNRARLIVGSFLTKDLGLDWRLGEQHFMRWLIDGDEANNNGNWQWIASVGVDPAPLFRRLYNPTTQQIKFDPNATYVHTFVPELSKVPKQYISEPWKMPEQIQVESNCFIGTTYPQPIVDHKLARAATLERYYGAASATPQ